MSQEMEGFSRMAGDLAKVLFESRTTGVCILRDGMILAANPLVGEMTEKPDEEIKGKPWLELASREDLPFLGSGRGQGTSRETTPFHFRLSTPRGETRWVVGTLTPLPSPAGSDELLLLSDVSRYERIHDDASVREQDTLAMTEGTLLAIEKIVEMKDPFIAGHQRRVARLSYAISRRLGLSESSSRVLRMAALVHDVGKVSIPIQVLAKPMHLSEDEYSIVRMHPLVGYEILKDIDHLAFAAEIILQHHERVDGSGYPSGRLTGDRMLPEARIISVADAMEAMISRRPHRPALGLEEALGEIDRGRGLEYDPDVVDACLDLFKEPGFTLESRSEGDF
ncbi:MAG: HD domain-containing protein [Synergistota bacterium]|nr:HD domain-containing protein [Synergistota bacterium]